MAVNPAGDGGESRIDFDIDYLYNTYIEIGGV